MAMTTTEDALTVRPSVRAQLGPIGFLVVIIALYVLAAVFGVLPLPIVVACGLVFAAALGLALLTVARSLRTPWELRIDASGISVRDRGLVAWSGLAEVTVSPLQPGRWAWLSLGQRVVAFVGKPGVELPSLPSSDLPGPLRRWSEKRRLRMVGTLLIVPPALMNASPAELEQAVQRLSDVPVVHRLAGR